MFSSLGKDFCIVGIYSWISLRPNSRVFWLGIVSVFFFPVWLFSHFPDTFATSSIKSSKLNLPLGFFQNKAKIRFEPWTKSCSSLVHSSHSPDSLCHIPRFFICHVLWDCMSDIKIYLVTWQSLCNHFGRPIWIQTQFISLDKFICSIFDSIYQKSYDVQSLSSAF